MGYTPNNPYIPGDPYSYDLRWMIEALNEIKRGILRLEQTYTTPTVVDLASEMIDVNKIYVYVGNEVGYQPNHWYYYDLDTHLWADGGIYGSITPDSALSTTSTNAVENRVITNALNLKFNTADIDQTLNPTGTYPVANSVITNALALKFNTADIDAALNASSSNPVANSVITNALAGKQNTLTFPLSISNGGTGMNSSTESTAISGAELYKWGKVVHLNCYSAPVNASHSIGTLPDGFRPHHWMYVAGTLNDGSNSLPARLTIEANGTTNVTYFNGTTYVSASAGNLYCDATFLLP